MAESWTYYTRSQAKFKYCFFVLFRVFLLLLSGHYKLQFLLLYRHHNHILTFCVGVTNIENHSCVNNFFDVTMTVLVT